jgi:hypothetical protein
LCVEENDSLNTLEPSVLAANLSNFEEFRSIVYRNHDIASRDADSINKFMQKNKTEWSMRVFTDTRKITYPAYIMRAIGK